jgi:cation:H+ antiporter
MWSAITLAAGVLLLYLGAEWLIRGSAGLGRSFGISPLVIGLTIVAYGTSAPEFVVSVTASFQGMSGLALGNVIGSNLANLGLILGLTTLVSPLAVEGTLIRLEAPVMIVTSLSIPYLLSDGIVSRTEGMALVCTAAVFTWVVARSSIRERSGRPAAGKGLSDADRGPVDAPPGRGRLRLAGRGLAGLILLIVGGQVFVAGAAGLAHALGLSDRVIGLTVAAVGTSTPELAASIVAALRGYPSIAVGNVIGSNIFNVLFVLGGASAIHPIKGSVRAFALDLAALALLSALGLVLVRGPRLIRRSEGFLLLGCYFGYMVLLRA